MKQFLLILLSVSLAATVNSQSILDKVKKKLNTNSGLTEEEAGRGVKEALNNGIGSAVSFLNKPDAFFKNELYKVLLPPDAKKMEKTLPVKESPASFENYNIKPPMLPSHLFPLLLQ